MASSLQTFGIMGGVVLATELLHSILHSRRNDTRRPSKPCSDLKLPGRTFCVVTTASLPWRTGTSINPALRAAELAKHGKDKVVLVLPFVELEDQQLLYPDELTFSEPKEQEMYVKGWLEERTGQSCNIQIIFYLAKYLNALGSIFPVEDIPLLIPDHLCDVAILEEPEHLNWFERHTRWTDRFRHVVGIIHTNYLAYVEGASPLGFLGSPAVCRINKWMCRIHCHKVIKLSDAVQRLPRSVTCNVHGVSDVFLRLGHRKAQEVAAWLELHGSGVDLRRLKKVQDLQGGGRAGTEEEKDCSRSMDGADGQHHGQFGVMGNGLGQSAIEYMGELGAERGSFEVQLVVEPDPSQNQTVHLLINFPATKPLATCQSHTGKAVEGSPPPDLLKGEGSSVEEPASNPSFVCETPFCRGAYFLGKAVWGKGYHELLDLLEHHQRNTGHKVEVEVFGSGSDLKAIQEEAERKQLTGVCFAGGRDHADESIQQYQVFVNPSRSDVVATTTGEALAMNKWVVVEDIPCNASFRSFSNCLMYTSPQTFSEQLEHALTHLPSPMTEEDIRQLSWPAATERLLEVGSIKADEWPSAAEASYDTLLWRMYRSLIGLRALQEALGRTVVGEEIYVPEEVLTEEDLEEVNKIEETLE